MNPSADAFVPGEQHEIPSGWSKATTQQANGRNRPIASASSVEDFSYLAPVIHRFQKHLIEPILDSSDTDPPLDVHSKSPDIPSLLDTEPEPSVLLTSRHPPLENLLVENRPFQNQKRMHLPGFSTQSFPKPRRMTNPMEARRHGETATNDSAIQLNEHLTERFGRGKGSKRNERSPSPTDPGLIMKVNPAIREYQKVADSPGDEGHWSGFREVPESAEVWSDSRKAHDDPVELEPNIVAGPYASINDYLERHYMLLREDAVAPLRNAVSEIQAYPHLLEKNSREDACVYERVYITGFTFANAGIAARISFSLKRVGKRVNWEQSKRLQSGNIVALTPAKDGFRTICRVATIAGRPMSGLEQNPPEIDVFFASAEEIEIDPRIEWIMVESRNGFYEGSRHTLRSLQMLLKETASNPLEKNALNTTSLLNHIIDLDEEVGPPNYVQQQPIKDLRPLFPENGEMGGSVLESDILEDWPKLPSHLDDSQLAALKRILTKRLAIVQGPPGTGKTFVSVAAINLMVHNMDASDPPIIIAAHTNHALDQLLRHISKFEPEFIRVGAMTTDVEIIKPRTLYEVKQAIKPTKMPGGMRLSAKTQLKKLTAELKEILGPLTQGNDVFSAALFKQYNIISELQYASLSKGAEDWVHAPDTSPKEELALWLGQEKIEAERLITPEDLGIDVEFEEIDLEFEQLKEIEAETRVLDDDFDLETLQGERAVLREQWVGRKAAGTSEQLGKDELEKKDMWDVPPKRRGPVYNRMANLLKVAIRSKFCLVAQKYAEAARNFKTGKWEIDFNYLNQARVIGMTTTGLSKYRGLIQSLRPKVVLIEEAAETLEGFVGVACMKSVEHLILVGDHQQLRGRVNDQELEGNPFYLDVSMFERLVRNHVEFTQLKRQRRMIPEIRRVLQLIYEELEDHESVQNRAAIPGMGGINSFFFTHKARDDNDAQMSKINHAEADLIVSFYVYLNQNGTAPKDITVITFYNGQRKLIFRKLREQPMLSGERFKVVTVDSYQGEENALILLSLVRCNEQRRIGFLGNENRVCVALSRAQRGFYIFGDAENLCKSSMLWWYVVKAMAKKPCRVGFHLPLTCTNHGNVTFVKDAEDIARLSGGCSTVICREELACGHTCTLNCHPFSHDFYDCPKHCTRSLPCGHPCVEICSAECKAKCTCNDNDVDADTHPLATEATGTQGTSSRPSAGKPIDGHEQPPTWDLSKWNNPQLNQFSTQAKAYKDFAQGGHVESDGVLARRAKEAAAKKVQEEKDMDQFDALFGASSKPSPVDEKHGTKVLRVRTDEQGATRTLYREKYTMTRSGVATLGDQGEEIDLLDL